MNEDLVDLVHQSFDTVLTRPSPGPSISVASTCDVAASAICGRSNVAQALAPCPSPPPLRPCNPTSNDVNTPAITTLASLGHECSQPQHLLARVHRRESNASWPPGAVRHHRLLHVQRPQPSRPPTTIASSASASHCRPREPQHVKHAMKFSCIGWFIVQNLAFLIAF
ncbi:hypothetical protein D9611_005246 [Ephemerocybe angulata]|uniref:Uncharacterized protein n=1 Tax=Ephemerocybe angulata TaxID=980116 RepID=A0A8H5C0U9_9AGAR|nr:hypothetical protein D9611_005246 [Tulosesus angulatus]